MTPAAGGGCASGIAAMVWSSGPIGSLCPFSYVAQAPTFMGSANGNANITNTGATPFNIRITGNWQGTMTHGTGGQFSFNMDGNGLGTSNNSGTAEPVFNKTLVAAVTIGPGETHNIAFSSNAGGEANITGPMLIECLPACAQNIQDVIWSPSGTGGDWTASMIGGSGSLAINSVPVETNTAQVNGTICNDGADYDIHVEITWDWDVTNVSASVQATDNGFPFVFGLHNNTVGSETISGDTTIGAGETHNLEFRIQTSSTVAPSIVNATITVTPLFHP